MSKALLITTLTSLIVSAIIGILIFLFGDFNNNQQHLLLTTLAVGGFSLIGLANTARRSAWWLWPLRPVGLATAVVALGLAVPLIWELLDDTEAVWRSFATLSVLAITSAHVSLLGAFDSKNNIVWVWRIVAMLIAVGVAYLIIYAVWGYINEAQREFFLRGIGVAAILDVLGTVGLYPLSKLVGNSRRSAVRKPSSARISSPRRKPARRRLSPSR
ncbi:MAG TPA: hypothetical protein VFR55_05155 [Dehalococcoidia bacterium]|nr:hypothetical protein [Dehalococcoidia bacterium]